MKTKLIELAKKVGFGAILMQNVIYRAYPDLEPMRYYLWMCELQKWCREKYNIDIIITSELIGYGYLLYKRYPPKNIPSTFIAELYEQALEEGLYQTLLLIQEENE